MSCAVCGHENPIGNRFCTSCGADLAAQNEAAGHEASGSDSQDWLLSEVDRLRSEIERLAEAVNRSRQEAPVTVSPVRAPPAAAHIAPPPEQPPTTISDVADPPRIEPEQAAQGIFTDSSTDGFEFEARVGAQWLAWVGVVALTVGSAFFLRLAYDNGWIQQTSLVVLGVVFGAVLTGLGEYWHRRYPVYAATLAGGGPGIIYLSFFAAHTPFDLIPIGVALLALFLVSVLLVVQAIRYEQLTLAVLAIGGAYLAPLGLVGVDGDVLGNASGSEVTWPVAYLFVVGLGVLYVSTRHNWRGIVVLGLLGSVVGYLRWYAEVEDITGNGTAQLWLTALFLIWVGGALVHHYLRRIEPDGFDIFLSVTNAVFFALMSYAILWTDNRGWMGAFTLGLGIFYGIVGYVLYRRSEKNVSLALAMGVMALAISAIAVPIQLSGPWVTAVWFTAALAFMAASAARSASMSASRAAGFGVLALATAWLLVIDVREAWELGIDPVFNRYVLSFASGAVAAYGIAGLIRRFPAISPGDEKITDAEIVSGLVMLGSGFITIGIWTQIPEQWFALAWGVEAVILGALSFGINLPEARRTVYGLLALATVRALVFDSYVDADGYAIFWNERAIAFLPIIFAVALGGLTLRKRADVFGWESLYVVPAMALVCNALLLWYLSAEVIWAISSEAIDIADTNEENVISLSLSVLWTGYAGIGLVLGVFKKWKRVRAAALLLLAVPVIKLFVFDTFALDSGYRVAAFMTLGFLLVAGGYLYQRYEGAVKGFLFETNDDLTGSLGGPHQSEFESP